MASKVSEEVKALVELEGNPVGMDSEECNQWRKEHENCSDCLYELGCTKMVGMMLSCMDVDPNEKIETILESNDSEAIRNVNFNFVQVD